MPKVRQALFWSAISENLILQEITVVDPSEATLERYRREFASVQDRIKMNLIKLSFAGLYSLRILLKLLNDALVC